jgi:hypothetical protein
MLYRKDSRIFGPKALVFYVVSNHPLPGLYTGLVPLPSHMQVRHSHTLHVSLSSSASDTSLDWKLSFTIIIDCSEADKLILVLKQSAYCIDLYFSCYTLARTSQASHQFYVSPSLTSRNGLQHPVHAS